MRNIAALLLAAAAPAAAQQSPMTFEAAKQLPLTSGQWEYFATAGGSMSSFGTVIQLRCDRATRTVTISRPNAGPAALTIMTDSVTRALPPSGRLLANDPLLDAIAFSRGRFVVSGGIGPTAAVPSWPEAARSIEDCRN
jgi:polyisoprenoid-binding protein YceI